LIDESELNRKIPPITPLAVEVNVSSSDVNRSNISSPDEDEKVVLKVCSELDDHLTQQNWS